MKKILCAVLAVVVAAGSVSAVEVGSVGTVAAADDLKNGDTFTDGDITYTVTSSTTVDVKAPANKNTITKAVIPSEVNGRKVTSIATDAFSSCKILTSAEIPESVTVIRANAFKNCANLKTVTIKGAADLGNYAFKDCTKLAEIKMDKITGIGSEVFMNCTSLTEVTVPSSAKGIGSAFQNCTGLKKATLYNTGSLGYHAFSGCTSLTEVTMDGPTDLWSNAFNGCTSLKTVTMNTVKEVGQNAFNGCTSLTTVSMNSVETLDLWCFGDCTSLETLNLPATLSSFRVSSFEGCSSLKALNVDAKNANFSSVDGVLFNKDKTELKVYPAGRTAKSYTVPEGVVTVGTDAFLNAVNLTTIKLSDGVVGINDYAFENCTGLTTVIIPASVINIGNRAFRQSEGIKDVYYGGSQADWADITIDIFNDPIEKATKHYNSDGPVGAPVEVKVKLPAKNAPAVTGLQAETTVGGKTVILPIDADGNLDITGVPDNDYIFKFSAKQCAPRDCKVTVSGGIVTGLEDGVVLHLLGDVNGDGVVNTQDVAKANAHVKGTSTLKGYELTCINVNKDSSTNVQDVALMNAHAKNTKLMW